MQRRILTIPTHDEDEPTDPRHLKPTPQESPGWWHAHLQVFFEQFLRNPTTRARSTLQTSLNLYEAAVRRGEVPAAPARETH